MDRSNNATIRRRIMTKLDAQWREIEQAAIHNYAAIITRTRYTESQRKHVTNVFTIMGSGRELLVNFPENYNPDSKLSQSIRDFQVSPTCNPWTTRCYQFKRILLLRGNRTSSMTRTPR